MPQGKGGTIKLEFGKWRKVRGRAGVWRVPVVPLLGHRSRDAEKDYEGAHQRDQRQEEHNDIKPKDNIIQDVLGVKSRGCHGSPPSYAVLWRPWRAIFSEFCDSPDIDKQNA